MQSSNLSSGGVFVAGFLSTRLSEVAGTVDIPLVPPAGHRVRLGLLCTDSNTSPTEGVSVLVNGVTVISGTLDNDSGTNTWAISGNYSGNTTAGLTNASGIQSPIIGGVDETILIRMVGTTRGIMYNYQTGVTK
jgi:hypothetical protein